MPKDDSLKKEQNKFQKENESLKKEIEKLKSENKAIIRIKLACFAIICT